MPSPKKGGRMAAIAEKAAKLSGGADIVRDMVSPFDNAYGLKLPNIAMRYLIGIDVLPLERSMQLCGPEGSGKSIFGWYLQTLFLGNGGMTLFVDAENKTNWSQVKGMMYGVVPNDVVEMNLMKGLVPKTQQEMFAHQQFAAQQACEFNSSGDVFPWCLFTDSINYLGSEDMKDNMEKNDYTVGFGHAHKANNLSAQLSTFVPQYIEEWPGIYLGINHQKEQLDGGGGQYAAKKTSEAGGKHKDFLWTYNIEFRKGSWANSINGLKRQGLTLKTKKSGYADTGRKIGLVMETRQVVEDGNFVGIDVSFDWDTCLAELIMGTPEWDKKATFCPADLREEILGKNKKDGKKYSCDMLGLKDVSAHEFGAVIQAKCDEDKQFEADIHRLLWIENKPVFDPNKWVAPSSDKMSVDEVRELTGTKKKPASRKKSTSKPKAKATATAPAVQAPPVEAPPVGAVTEAPPVAPAPPTVSSPPRVRGGGPELPPGIDA